MTTLHESRIVLPLGPQEPCMTFKGNMSCSGIGFTVMTNVVTYGLSDAACAPPHTGQLASQIADSGDGLGIPDSASMWSLARSISEVWKVDW